MGLIKNLTGTVADLTGSVVETLDDTLTTAVDVVVGDLGVSVDVDALDLGGLTPLVDIDGSETLIAGPSFVIEQLAEISTARFNFTAAQSETPGIDPAEVEARLRDLDAALDGARVIEDADGAFELRFLGEGVSGALNTNADFDSLEAAEAFLDGLKVAAAQPDTFQNGTNVAVLGGTVEAGITDSSGGEGGVIAGAVGSVVGGVEDVLHTVHHAAEDALELVGDVAGDVGELAGSLGDGAVANLDDFVFETLANAGAYIGDLFEGEHGGLAVSADVLADVIVDPDLALLEADIVTDLDGNLELSLSGDGVTATVNTDLDLQTEAEAAQLLEALVTADLDLAAELLV